MSYTPQWGPGQSGQSQPGTYGQPVSDGGYGQPGGYDSGGYGGQGGQGGQGGGQGGFGGQGGGYGGQGGGYGGQGGQGGGQGGFGGQGGGFGGNQGGFDGGGGFGGNQYGGQPGGQPANPYGGQQQPFGGFGPPSGPPPQPPRRRRFGGLIRFLVLIAVVGGIAVAYPVVIRPALAKFGNEAAKDAEEEAKEGARTAQVGECVIDKNAPGASAPADSDDVKLRVVPCDGPEAGYKVLGIVPNKLQAEADADDVCAASPEADVVYWEGYTGRAGLVLCLQTLKK